MAYTKIQVWVVAIICMIFPGTSIPLNSKTNTEARECNFFLTAPKKVSANFFECHAEHDFTMIWGLKNQFSFAMWYCNNQMACVMQCPQLPDQLSTEEKNRFNKKIMASGSQIFWLSIGVELPPHIYESIVNYTQDLNFLDQHHYIAKRRIIAKNDDRHELLQEQLYEIIKSKRIVFYTGAGISASADVWTMPQLEKAMGIGDKEDLVWIPDLVRCILHQPHQILETAAKFFHGMFNHEPTKAHIALTSLAQHKQCQIITENLDYLHQRTGIEPYVIKVDEFLKTINPKSAQEIDAVICCGLSHDDRGFLGWYKEHNLQGSIVAIDIKKPSYIGDNDFVVYADLQEIIPSLCADIVK